MVNAEFFDALEQLEKEKGIPVDYMLDRVGQALITAYKRDNDGMTDNVYVEPNREEKTIRIKLRNHSRNIQEFVNFKWYLPDEWTVSPARSGKVFMTTPFLHKADAELAFTFTIPQMQPVERLVLELTMDGRSFVQLVPVVFTREFR